MLTEGGRGRWAQQAMWHGLLGRQGEEETRAGHAEENDYAEERGMGEKAVPINAVTAKEV